MKSKILFIALDGEITGANLSMLTLAEGVRNQGLEVHVVIPRNGSLEKTLNEKQISYSIITSYPWIKNKEDNFIVNFLKNSIKKVINAKAEREIRSVIKEKQIGILHINGIGYGVGAKAALKCNIKLVWHIREMLEEDFHDELYHKKKSYALIGKADKIITISECVKNKYKQLISSSNMVRIYNGIPTQKYQMKEHNLFSGEKVKIMYAGTLSEAKGIMELIEAVSMLRQDLKEKIEVTAIGRASEEYSARLQKRIKELKLENIVTLKGFVENVALEWQKADIGCVCSRFEAFGRVTVEAMMAGCLVIGADTGGTVEIIEDNRSGLLYHQGSSKDLAEKIEYAVMNQAAMCEIAGNGQKRAAEKFSEERNTREIYQIYKTLLEN